VARGTWNAVFACTPCGVSYPVGCRWNERLAQARSAGLTFTAPCLLQWRKVAGRYLYRETRASRSTSRFLSLSLSSLPIARMPRQRIGARVAMQGGAASSPAARNGCRDNTFVLGERRATSCLLFRPRSVLSVYSETSASHETVCLCPFPFPVPMRRIAILPPLRFSCACLYLSICPPPRASPFSSIRLARSPPSRYLASPRHLPRPPPRSRGPLFLFYKIDRTGETEETRSVGRNARI